MALTEAQRKILDNYHVPPKKVETHGVRITFGKHGPKNGSEGELFTRIDVGYLQWMVNNKTRQWGYADAELRRRGTVFPDINISGHAIDRASLRCRKAWHLTALNEEEGLHAWLVRMSLGALSANNKKGDKYLYRGMKFVFELGYTCPTLKTIMPPKHIEDLEKD